MSKITIILIPDGHTKPRQIRIPIIALKYFFIVGILFSACAGYFSFDYYQLLDIRAEHHKIIDENQVLKGEARILSNNIEDVKQSLSRVREYTKKLDELVSTNVKKPDKKQSIGPLSQEEFEKAVATNDASQDSPFLPMGIKLNDLSFKSIFVKLAKLDFTARFQEVELQRLLTALSERKSILSAIPSINPVHNGWIASGFGVRISPFTAESTKHNGIDIAASIGTPVQAPADGIVIFSGFKEDFGNFIMIAHYENGIVTKYGHNAQNLVQVGQRVKRGEQIATVGMTGKTTGPHCHYEIWVDGILVNPMKFIL